MLFMPSPSPPNHTRVITSADYLDDEKIDEYLSQLAHEEGGGGPALGEPGPSNEMTVVCHFFPLIVH